MRKQKPPNPRYFSISAHPMKKHLPTISRAMGILLITSVLALTAYSYYTAKHLTTQLHDLAQTQTQSANQPQHDTTTSGIPISSGIDLISHDTYYVVASIPYTIIAIATLAAGVFLLILPRLITKHPYQGR